MDSPYKQSKLHVDACVPNAKFNYIITHIQYINCIWLSFVQVHMVGFMLSAIYSFCNQVSLMVWGQVPSI